jgi:hypothetical protein
MQSRAIPLTASHLRPLASAEAAVAIITSIRLTLATVILLVASSPLPGRVGDHVPEPPETVVLLDFSSSASEHFWKSLKTELERPEIAQFLGRQIFWMRREQFRMGMEFPEVLQVSVQGNCMASEPSDARTLGPLGWVYVVSAQIQPFAFLNCTRIRQYLAPSMRQLTTEEQEDMIARAVARIIAHEVTHILTRNSRHARWGLQKPFLSRGELLGPTIPSGHATRTVFEVKADASTNK